MNEYSKNEERLFETLDALNKIHDEELDDLDYNELIQYAQARAQIMLTAEVHKMRVELVNITRILRVGP
ncbi:MAG: hypothetical protein M3112_00310 [Actinomycetia bacterium]|nr:hypothetical protein [Actinomycetes bacterium]